MSDESTKKINFFNRVLISIKDFEKYGILASEKTKTAIGYLVIMIVIFSLVITGATMFKFVTLIQNGINYINNDINEIVYSNETLSINSRRRDKAYK